jgi:tetratricopeptide (TPR) repeat protein
MPYTHDGIGTLYYGKRNATQREAECHSCHHHTVLSSYDTRLFVVICYIPVFPLGRKRVVDECAICRRHYEFGAGEYEKLSTDSIDKGMEDFKNDPSAESALGVHGRLVAFQKFEEAKEFRDKALQFFGNDAEFMIELAAQLDEMSRTHELIPLLDLILLADPTNKMIRARQAVLLSQRGDIDRARPLLDYLEKPGAFVDSSPAPLVHLAEMFSRQGRHDDALKMLEHIVRELPKLGSEPAFRRLVLGIEKKAGRTVSIVPTPKNSMLGILNPFNEDVDPGRRKVVWIAAGVVAVLALLAGINYYISQHRQLHIANGFSKGLQVSIDDGPPILVPPGRTDIAIKEGKHKAKVTGGVDEEFDFDMRAGYFERFFRRPTWVLTPGEGVALVKVDFVYAEIPEPDTKELLFGKRLYYVPHCDYPFVDPPHEIQIKKNQKVPKVALAIPRLSVDQVATYIKATDPDASMRYLERHLTDTPSNDALGFVYSSFGAELKKEKRVLQFLRDGLDKRPVVVEWHRVWSSIIESSGKIDEAIAYYDQAIKAEGESAPLLYLRSRIDLDAQRSADGIAEALRLDPKFGWAWYAEGVGALSRTDFITAKEDLKKAMELGVSGPTAEPYLFVAQLGNGEASQLVNELRTLVQREATNPIHIEYLTTALIASGNEDDARKEFDVWAQKSPVRTVLGDVSIKYLRRRLMFRLHDAKEFASVTQQLAANGPGNDAYFSEYLMVMGRANDAEVQPPPQAVGMSENLGLKMALAYHLDGDPERSKGWAERVAASWDTHAGPERKAAGFLRATEIPSYDEVVQTRINFADKALLAALIARRFPGDGEPFSQLAKKLMINRDLGSWLVAKALESQ